MDTRKKKALKCFDEVIKINPEDADAFVDKGICLRKMGMGTEALKTMIKPSKLIHTVLRHISTNGYA